MLQSALMSDNGVNVDPQVISESECQLTPVSHKRILKALGRRNPHK